MSRKTRRVAILGKIETTYGVDPVPTGAANAILVTNPNIVPLNAQNVSRELIRQYFGNSQELVGPANKEITYAVEIAGSGTKGVAPAYGPWLRACGFAESVVTDEYVEYLPRSDGFESMAQYFYDDGVLHKLLGGFGNVQFAMPVGQIPRFNFRFLGLDGSDSTASLPTSDYSDFQIPKPVSNANSGGITFGATYAAGAISGGTEVQSMGINIDLANALSFTPLLGAETVDITDRQPSGDVTLDLSAAQEVSNMTAVREATTQSLAFEHGTADGHKILVFMPAVQLVNPRKADQNGRRLIAYDLRIMPDEGNDEIRFVVK